MSVKAMIKKSILESDMYNQSISLSTLMTIMVDMLLALIIGLLIYEIYKRYFCGVVYSRTFALTLIGMTVLTCMVTLAISTNIVISLGMVGALSIVRYRSAVKEPLDIMYLFWAITMGITIGASMYLLCAAGMLFMLLIVAVMHRRQEKARAYVMIFHGDSEAEKSVLELIKDIPHGVKSKITRDSYSEISVTLDLCEKELDIADKVKAVSGVKDVTLISYNGEYHG